MAGPKLREERERIQGATTEDLRNELRQIRRRLFELRFQAATDQVNDSMAIRRQRKTYARILTELRRREDDGQPLALTGSETEEQS